MNKKINIAVGITGASGSLYARLLCQKLCQIEDVGTIAIIATDNGMRVMAFEDSSSWIDSPRYTKYDNHDLFSAPASGSAQFDAMVIIPCTMGMLGRIASGVSNDLVSRCADVMLKERKRLIMVTREAPLSTIHLRNMTTLSECGAVICPASPSFYSKPSDMEELCMTIVERVTALLALSTPRYEWRG